MQDVLPWDLEKAASSKNGNSKERSSNSSTQQEESGSKSGEGISFGANPLVPWSDHFITLENINRSSAASHWHQIRCSLSFSSPSISSIDRIATLL